MLFFLTDRFHGPAATMRTHLCIGLSAPDRKLRLSREQKSVCISAAIWIYPKARKEISIYSRRYHHVVSLCLAL